MINVLEELRKMSEDHKAVGRYCSCSWHEWLDAVIGDAKETAIVTLPIKQCGRLFLPGQLHDAHMHVLGGEHVYCTGAVS